MKRDIILHRVKEYIVYSVYRSIGFSEYITDAFINWSLTRNLINCSSKERIEIFAKLTTRSFLCIFVTNLIFEKIVEPFAFALFNDLNLSILFYPFCVFMAWKSLNNICDDFS